MNVIFVLMAVLLVAAWRYAVAYRKAGMRATVREISATALAGLAAGIWIGLVARLGMRLVAVAGGATPRFSFSGTLEVIMVYAGLGGLCALYYGAFLRSLLRRSGAAYGLVLFLAGWFPIGETALRLLPSRTDFALFVAASGAVVAMMFIPYGLLLERLLQRLLARVELIGHTAG